MDEITINYSRQRIVKGRKKLIIREMVTKKDISLIMGANLARLRKSHGFSQQQLAEIVDSTASYISQMEKGHSSISTDMLTKLCNALKADVSEFTFSNDKFILFPPPTGEIAVISMANGGPDGFYEDSYPAGYGFKYIKRPHDVTDESAYAVEVSGLSMSPRYEEGEIVVASPEKEVHSGDYVVVKTTDGEVMKSGVTVNLTGTVK